MVGPLNDNNESGEKIKHHAKSTYGISIVMRPSAPEI